MLDVTRAYGLTLLFPQDDEVIGPYLKTYGHFAPAEIDLFGDYMADMESGTFLDLGGNIGSISLPLAKRFPDWRVITVEGHRGLSQVLATNAFSNHLYNVEVVHAAVGEIEGIIDFPEPPLRAHGNFGVLSLARDSKFPTSRVLMQRVDDLATPDTRIIKIDIEGYEATALRGATATLAAKRSILFLESNPKFGTSAVEVNGMLLAAGYRLFFFFSPSAHVTAPPKRPLQNAKISGDPSVLALPPGVENIWNLPPLLRPDEPHPVNASVFKYLARYGYRVDGARRTTPSVGTSCSR